MMLNSDPVHSNVDHKTPESRTMVHDPTLAPIARTADLRALEVRHAADGLMERAGAAAAEVARGMLADRREPVVVLAGPGNNGGDAFVVARLLRAAFFDVVVVSIADPAKLPKDAAAACAAYRIEEGSIASAPPAQRPALIVDGLFGVGLTRALLPYLLAQLAVLALVLAEPGLVWQRNPIELAPTGAAPKSEQEGREMLERQLDQQLQQNPSDGEVVSPAPSKEQPR